VVVPTANLEPEVAVLVRVGAEQLSVALGAVHVAITVLLPLVVTVMFAGQLTIAGGTMSFVQALKGRTVTVNEQVEVLLATSRAV
jgi:hypothetical protein